MEATEYAESSGASPCQEGPMCPLAEQDAPSPWSEHLRCTCVYQILQSCVCCKKGIFNSFCEDRKTIMTRGNFCDTTQLSSEFSQDQDLLCIFESACLLRHTYAMYRKEGIFPDFEFTAVLR